MMLKKIGFILLSFLSSFGDSVFLSGVPLYLYKSGGNSIFDTTLVTVAITLTVIVARKPIARINSQHPLLVTGVGELLMGLVELMLLAAYIIYSSKWLIVLGVIPLALIYNSYGAAKFYRIQDYVFGDDSHFYVSLQSAANRIGMLMGVAASGWLVTRSGVKSILLVDSASFLFYGIIVIYLFSRSRVSKPELSKSNSIKTFAQKSLIGISRNYISYGLVFMFVAGLFTTWEQASSVAIVSKLSTLPLDQVSRSRAILSGVGILAGLVSARFFPRMLYSTWLVSILILTIGVSLLAGASLPIVTVILFFAGGLLASITVPVQRELFSLAGGSEEGKSALAATYWIYGAGLKLMIAPITWIAESKLVSFLNSLQSVTTLIFLVGIVGGYLISKTAMNRTQQLQRQQAIIVGACAVCFVFLTVAITGKETRLRTPYRTALLGGYISSFDPIAANEYNELTFFSQICGRLTSVDESLNMEGDLAKDWQMDSTRTIIDFTLRPGRHFANGSEVTADDVIYSFNRIMAAHDSIVSSWAENIRSVSSPKPNQIEISLKRPNLQILYVLSHPRFCVLSHERPFLEVDGVKVPNSSGAYQVSRARSPRILLKVTQDFSESAIEKQVEVSFATQAEAVEQFAKGKLDDLSFYLLSDSEIDLLRSQAKVIPAKLYWTWTIMLNPNRPLFKSTNIRRRMTSAIDTRRILSIWKADTISSRSMIPQGMRGFGEKGYHFSQIKHPLFERCEAPIRVAAIEGLPDQLGIGVALTKEISRVSGCKTQVAFLEMGKFVAEMATGNYDVYVSGQDTNSTDPIGFYRQFVSDESDNLMKYNYSPLNRAYSRLREVALELRSQSDYDDLQRAFYEAGFGLALGYPQFKFVYRNDVTSTHMNPLGMPLNRWWKIGRL